MSPRCNREDRNHRIGYLSHDPPIGHGEDFRVVCGNAMCRDGDEAKRVALELRAEARGEYELYVTRSNVG